jgi:hypothetical protein
MTRLFRRVRFALWLVAAADSIVAMCRNASSVRAFFAFIKLVPTSRLLIYLFLVSFERLDQFGREQRKPSATAQEMRERGYILQELRATVSVKRSSQRIASD